MHYTDEESVDAYKVGDTYDIPKEFDMPPELQPEEGGEHDHRGHTATVTAVLPHVGTYEAQQVHVRCSCGGVWAWTNDVYRDGIDVPDQPTEGE